jgi:hypothetical protein
LIILLLLQELIIWIQFLMGVALGEPKYGFLNIYSFF